ncbi:MAG: diaminopimelate epimerase [Thioalkalispiraceae bacterium]|jgi:diaminopimelate epimerase
MYIHFSKMEGLGNDFVVIDGINQQIKLNSEQIRQIADRHFGIGCDQLLLVEKPEDSSVLFNYRIFNANGEEVEQCGNGARCFARFVHEKGLTQNREIPVKTRSGKLILSLDNENQVTVNMGVPEFEPENIPFLAKQRASHYRLELENESVEIGAVALGNPHAVMQVADIESAPVDTLGPQIEAHPMFPQHVNAGFMQIVDQNLIKLRVYERGVGETLACGSGACAAVVLGRQWQLLSEKVQVQLSGGTLIISWQGEGQPVMMTGPANTVFEGSIEI